MSKSQVFSPFITRTEAPAIGDFDKYYYDITEKEVFKETGEVDPDTGEKLGVVEKKFLVKKIDIVEHLNSQRDMVGVDNYCKALALQGDSIDNYATNIDSEKVMDFSEMPDTLADVLTAGDRAKAAFEQMDPALKGSHTTIEGFLNSLSQETLDNYIKSRVEALYPSKSENVEKGE